MPIKFNNDYYHQVELLLSIMPTIAEEKCFALKGGTAINLFVQNMPRFSVDIDLTYLPIENRETSLTNIASSLLTIKNKIEQTENIKVLEKRSLQNKQLTKLFAVRNNVMVKIEPNDVLRGTIFPTVVRNLVTNAEQLFKISLSGVPILSVEELYAGKICAALSRQHPRDLFDIKILLENSGITELMRKAFVVYLASSSMPINELLNPNLINQQQIFEQEFLGMANVSTSYRKLEATRTRLINKIKRILTNNERQFLLSVKLGEPNWSLLPDLKIQNFPALNWKIMNIRQMRSAKHQESIAKLKQILVL
jgi:predicted nucleotidyltransferase component of viral defense system